MSPTFAWMTALATGLPPPEPGSWTDAVFKACVDALAALAARLGVSGSALNVWILCIAWPLLTLILLGTVLSQRRRIQRLQRSLRIVVSTKL